MRKRFFTLIIIGFYAFSAYSQTPIGTLIDGTAAQPKFIIFDERLPRSTNPKKILQANLQLNTNTQYVLNQQVTDKLGRTHEKYQQQYKGIKVSTGTYVVHYDLDGTIGAINGNYYPITQLGITPTLTEAAALLNVLNTINAQEYMWQNPQSEQWLRTNNKDSAATFYPKGELMIFPVTDSLDSIAYHLGYQFNVICSQPFASEMITIDAINGNVIHQFSTFSDAFGDACTRYSGTTQISTELFNGNYRLHDNNRGGGIITYNLDKPNDAIIGGTNPANLPANPDFEDSDNEWTCSEWSNSTQDNVALDAHWAAEMTYDYFKQVHNRDSYDGLGSVLNIYVHFIGSSGTVAAEWLGTSQPGLGISGIALGDGDGTTYDPLVSLDIISHEFGHGVTQKTSKLLLSGSSESPSINEGLSDIWGAVVENWVVNIKMLNGVGDTDKDTWLAGEEVRLDFVATRSLKDPKSFAVATRMADTYGGDNYFGLRGKSGIMSHWFYLLSEGSALTDGVNDNGDSFTIIGIGIDKAADIVYLAQTIYFTELTNYQDARQATLQAAKDLYGSCSIEAQTVSEAWDAVGVTSLSVVSNNLACGAPTWSANPGVYDGSIPNVVVATDPYPNGVIFSNASICSTPVTVPNGATVVFKASSSVLLGPGFKAERGSNFKAYIFQCSGAGNYRVGNNSDNTTSSPIKNNMVTPQKSTLTVYPNPNNGQFTLTFKNSLSNNLIEVYSLMGKKIWSNVVTKNKTQIDISTQPKGIYLIKVISGNAIFTQKIIYQ